MKTEYFDLLKRKQEPNKVPTDTNTFPMTLHFIHVKVANISLHIDPITII